MEEAGECTCLNSPGKNSGSLPGKSSCVLPPTWVVRFVGERNIVLSIRCGEVLSGREPGGDLYRLGSTPRRRSFALGERTPFSFSGDFKPDFAALRCAAQLGFVLRFTPPPRGLFGPPSKRTLASHAPSTRAFGPPPELYRAPALAGILWRKAGWGGGWRLRHSREGPRRAPPTPPAPPLQPPRLHASMSITRQKGLGTLHVFRVGRHTSPFGERSHTGLTRRNRGVSDGGGITTLGLFHTFRKPCVAGYQNGKLCRFWVLVRGALEECREPAGQRCAYACRCPEASRPRRAAQTDTAR